MSKTAAVKKEKFVSAKARKRKELWQRFAKNKLALLGLGILGIFVIAIVFGNLIAPPENVSFQDYSALKQRPSAAHWFGTDHLGRDIFARVIHGTKYSMGIALAVNAASTLIGLFIGTIAAYYRGKADTVLMRIMDVLTSIPALLLSMSIVAAMGTSTFSLFVAMTLTGIPAKARMVRTSLLNVVDNEFVEACHACGTGTFRILTKHLIPNAIGPVIVSTTMGVASSILNCATLSFIGLGFQEPTPEWGAMLSQAREYFRTDMYLMVFPGIAVILASLSINLIGDGLRDALDPRLRD